MDCTLKVGIFRRVEFYFSGSCLRQTFIRKNIDVYTGHHPPEIFRSLNLLEMHSKCINKCSSLRSLRPCVKYLPGRRKDGKRTEEQMNRRTDEPMKSVRKDRTVSDLLLTIDHSQFTIDHSRRIISGHETRFYSPTPQNSYSAAVLHHQ